MCALKTDRLTTQMMCIGPCSRCELYCRFSSSNKKLMQTLALKRRSSQYRMRVASHWLDLLHMTGGMGQVQGCIVISGGALSANFLDNLC